MNSHSTLKQQFFKVAREKYTCFILQSLKLHNALFAIHAVCFLDHEHIEQERQVLNLVTEK